MSGRVARFFASRWGIILADNVIGVLDPLLQAARKPPNTRIGVAYLDVVDLSSFVPRPGRWRLL